MYSCPPCLAPVYSLPGDDEHFVKKAHKARRDHCKEKFYYLVQWYRLLHHGHL